MFHINHTDFFSIHANVCAQKVLKRMCPASDTVTALNNIGVFGNVRSFKIK